MATDLLKSDPILLRCITKNEVNLLSPTNQSSVLESNLFRQNNNVLSETDKDGISFRKDISPQSEQSNDSAAAETLAVSVRNLYLAYEKSHPIISNLNMSVRKGTVYGLLGSSGCGKTTLLNCMVGLKKWDLGEILVFNKRPGATNSEIPGAKLGYMPQDIALYDQLSVKEMLEYYGQLYGMPEKEVGEQIMFLIEFLKLPSKSNLIKELSGGQKRRVSLALALVHSPELLILDEPTVGLDPLLRESIWEYLFKMVEIRKGTVIITTHYIEEARFSNVIGVMRKGCLLVENSPDVLLKQFDCNLLEQVILKLCQKATSVAVGNDGKNGMPHSGYNTSSTSTINYSKELMPRDDPINRKAKSSTRSKTSYNVREKFQENWELRSRRRTSISMEDSDEKSKAIRSSNVFQRIQALSTVMWLLLFRHPIFTSMTLFLPAIQILLTVSVLGKDPNGMKIGVVNQELPEQYTNCPYQLMEKKTEFLKGIQNKSCDMTQLGCHFMKELNLVESIEAVPIRSLELAAQEVKNGNLWGYIIIPTNYSQNVVDFAVEQRFASNETLIGSRISFKMDMSNYLGAAIAIRSTFEAYASFMKTLAISCGFDPKEFQLPLLFREPVYGNNDASYHDFVTPVIFITVIFEMPMLVTSILFINDRKLGTLDRARVAGLRFKEVMASYMVTQGSIIIGQTIVCYAMVWTIYEFNVVGSMSLFFAVVLLCGVCGASLGLLCGIFFRDEVGVLMFGAFLAPTLLCYEGALWPLEAIPWIPWRAISYASPTTLLCASFRSIVSRGLGLTHSLVWPGIAVMSAHTVLYWVLSTLLFISKSK